MKKSQLRQIIKEEIEKSLNEKIYDSDLKDVTINQFYSSIKEVVDSLPIYSEEKVRDFVLQKTDELLKKALLNRKY